MVRKIERDGKRDGKLTNKKGFLICWTQKMQEENMRLDVLAVDDL